MNIEEMRERVYEANISLPKHGLVLLTWGNVSECDRETGLIAIKASGIPYDRMGLEHITVVDQDGIVVRGEYKPSVDLAIHRALYEKFPEIRSVVHTHSVFASIWAQMGRELPCYGTTHADYFYGSIPCTREMTQEEINTDYFRSTAKVIAEAFEKEGGPDYRKTQAVLVRGHGPFLWGDDPTDGVKHAVVLEAVAKMALFENLMLPEVAPLPKNLQDKHYECRFGPNSWYGQ